MLDAGLCAPARRRTRGTPNDAPINPCAFFGHGSKAVRLTPQGTNVTVRDCWRRDCRQGVYALNVHHLTLHGNQTRSKNDG